MAEGHDLTFKQALFTVSSNLLLIIGLPKWAFSLRKNWISIEKAHSELHVSLVEVAALSPGPN